MLTDRLIQGDWVSVAGGLPDEAVHCIVTSPPYYGLRNYQATGQLGLEKTPEEFIDRIVAGFREWRRVLRTDGTLWLNLGDSYMGGGRGYDVKRGFGRGGAIKGLHHHEIKDGNLCMMPSRVAMALQADGWHLRSQIIWAKGVSFCDSYSGSVMPESVKGWRWERCRIKVENSKRDPNKSNVQGDSRHNPESAAKYRNCPGCPKCESTDGYVLRQGAWRPTSAYEVVYLLTKSGRYFCDAEAVKEESTYVEPKPRPSGMERQSAKYRSKVNYAGGGTSFQGHSGYLKANGEPISNGKRNPRNVWAIGTKGFADAHFATYPERLVEPCIKAGTSEWGVCPECGSQWARVVEADKTLSFRPTCSCDKEPVPALIADPFMGSGTTAVVAKKLGRHYIGAELSADYIKMAKKRLAQRILV